MSHGTGGSDGRTMREAEATIFFIAQKLLFQSTKKGLKTTSTTAYPVSYPGGAKTKENVSNEKIGRIAYCWYSRNS
jgi:hypothetical protein